MSTRFIETIPIAITPLSPVHIGCGEDFEPINYFIEDKVLYDIDLALTTMPENLSVGVIKNLVYGSDKNALLQLQRRIKEAQQHFKAAACALIPVAEGVAKKYEESIGKPAQRETDQDVLDRLKIERHSYHPYTHQAIVPGSSLKGAIRTAWLASILSQSKTSAWFKSTQSDMVRFKTNRREITNLAKAVENKLMQGSFSKDPFRLLSIADTEGEPLRKIYFSVNHKKRIVRDAEGEIKESGVLSTRREAILPWQYRIFKATISLRNLQSTEAIVAKENIEVPLPLLTVKNFESLAHACNAYYLKRLERELKILEENRRVANPDWLENIRGLLNGEVGQSLKENRAFLLRMGRHSGAECLTLDEDLCNIKINLGRQKPPAYANKSTTLWVAAENDKQPGIPFGWMLVERADMPPIHALKERCHQEKPYHDELHKQLEVCKQSVDAARNSAQAEREKKQVQAEAQRQAKLAEAQKAAYLASLSEAMKSIETFKNQLLSAPKKEPIGGKLYTVMNECLKQAELGAWSVEEKKSLSDLILQQAFQKIDISDKKRKEIKLRLTAL